MPSKQELEAATKVIAAFDVRNADTLEKCEQLARQVLEAAEKVRKSEPPHRS